LLQIVVGILTAWLVLNAVYTFKKSFFEKHGVKLYYGFILVYKGRSVVFSSKLCRKVSYISIPLFVIAFYSFYNAMVTSILAKLGYVKAVPAQLLIPGVNVTGSDLLFFAIAIAIATTLHELAHALAAGAHGLKPKSLGVALLAILPVAFTELDEAEFATTPRRSKITILASGPAANFALALIALAVFQAIASPTGGLVIDYVESGKLADQYGIKPGDVLIKINGEPATYPLLEKVLKNENEVNITFTVMSSDGIRNIVIRKPANVTRLGIKVIVKPCDTLISVLGLTASVVLLKIIAWINIVNLGLAIVNAAPLIVSDGGRVIYEISSKKIVGHAINALSLAILVLGVIPLG